MLNAQDIIKAGSRRVTRLNTSPDVSEPDRIAALPDWYPEQIPQAELDAIEARLRLPGGKQSLRPIQALALYWIKQVGGLLGPIGTGHGKTLITALAPTVLGANRPLLLLPANMVDEFGRQLHMIRKHWLVSQHLRVLTYNKLSVLSGQELLTRLQPDLIICDEAHNLRQLDSTRTKRVIRYFVDNPRTKLVALSGTFTDKSLLDYAHLAELALRDLSPLPREKHDLEAWAKVVDKTGDPSNTDYANFSPIFPEWRGLPWQERKQEARARYRGHFTACRGVVATSESSVGCSLIFREHPIDTPQEVQAALDEVQATATRPDGEELTDSLSIHRVLMQLSSGFYYRWNWPDNKPDLDWLEARAAWHRAIRYVLSLGQPHLDSPLAVTRAVALSGYGGGLVRGAWDNWGKQKHKPQPPTETVWLSDFLFDAVASWLRSNTSGIVWYRDQAVEDMLRLMLPVFGRGTNPPTPEQIKQYPQIACSIRVHGTGKNLQHYANNLCLSFPTVPKEAEQLISRTHRPGQESDTVFFDYLAHTEAARNALTNCVQGAVYVQETMGQPQRVLYGTGLGQYLTP